MRKKKKLSFKELIMENKRELLSDRKAMERIEERFEEKHAKNL
ncbi:FbpB family small basic protein [Pseudalkalibacillus caeni]|uniref:FbpB family small basic protein n=1 Tax=Exobacillus caeni TaxID=2574798 RepID=A0A5R9F1D3_9BACL|nr:FbpB family small basic protein [Pseudalkalibacillus caeni]TLS37442.1 FbpB family small basic protein [Pseudalkalibacillus caeni]